MTRYQLLADRLRFLWQQPKISLVEAQEIVTCLPGIIAALDEAASTQKEIAQLRIDNARLRDEAFLRGRS